MNSNFKHIALENFKRYDMNNNESIELIELKKLMQDVSKEMSLPAPDEKEVQELLKQYDSNNDKVISFNEFLKLFEVLQNMGN